MSTESKRSEDEFYVKDTLQLTNVLKTAFKNCFMSVDECKVNYLDAWKNLENITSKYPTSKHSAELLLAIDMYQQIESYKENSSVLMSNVSKLSYPNFNEIYRWNSNQLLYYLIFQLRKTFSNNSLNINNYNKLLKSDLLILCDIIYKNNLTLRNNSLNNLNYKMFNKLKNETIKSNIFKIIKQLIHKKIEQMKDFKVIYSILGKDENDCGILTKFIRSGVTDKIMSKFTDESQIEFLIKDKNERKMIFIEFKELYNTY